MQTPETLPEFLRCFGDTFEHSTWVAEYAWGQGPFTSLDALHQAMREGVLGAGEERVIELLCAHPELAGKELLEGSLTADSALEQSGAGLDRLSAAALRDLARNNAAYRKRFGFPFIIALKLHSQSEMMQQLAARLLNSREDEIQKALEQVFLITRLRLQAKWGKAFVH